jgi:hypothetical protein
MDQLNCHLPSGRVVKLYQLIAVYSVQNFSSFESVKVLCKKNPVKHELYSWETLLRVRDCGIVGKRNRVFWFLVPFWTIIDL